MHPQEEYGKKVLEILQSFNKAMQDAGGCIFSAEKMREMSVEELLLLLAPNNIRFIYEKPVNAQQTPAGISQPQ